MVFLKFLSVIEELLLIQDQSRAGFGVYGNSRVLKCYRDWLNLGHSEAAARSFKSTSLASLSFEKDQRIQACLNSICLK